MDIQERLQFFYNTIKCCYPFYHWEYDAQMHLLETDSQNITTYGDLPKMLHLSDTLFREGEKGNARPIIYDTSFGLRWIVGFEYCEDQISRFHLLGPASIGTILTDVLNRHLAVYSLSEYDYFSSVHLVRSVPIVPSMVLSQYAVMLHYALTEEQITPMDIRILTDGENLHELELESGEREKEGIWTTEQKFLRMISEGNPHCTKMVNEFLTMTGGIQIKGLDPLRTGKDNAFVLLALVSRASMSGGLSPLIAYTLQDNYMEKLEHAADIEKIKQLSIELINRYVDFVRERKVNTSLSVAVQDACDYISCSLEEEMNLQALAHRVGYSEYYFNSKFQKETGKSIKEYILEKKMERAAELLKSSHLKISEIAEMLHIQSLSYFNRSFQRWAGVTPGAYRKKSH